ncbi:WXG100 family type VII secretion target [Mycobacterium sp. AZCC_0083]|uniref:WXG100 family type VII secretion target n=1 Tax=Mycobacterium sp. AZCC_0083 TaxID=2735882 RepID=UPI001608D415|nr:hypothetical protein [Mycobacterium sp. AZCC_0083]MBB5162477.1 hypothetical protein [Mycobacterium sp. AZCC_0083]
MAGVDGTARPSLSQIVNWDVKHLEQAASDWTSTATRWEGHFGTLHRATMSPGGSVWDGAGADAAQERSFADLVKVRGIADTLHDAAAIARRGADELHYAQRNAINAVAEAEEAGFIVGEDLSVADRQSGGGPVAEAQRASLAEYHAMNIGTRAVELGAADKSVAATISAATAPLSQLNFVEAPVDDQPPHNTNGSVQAVNYHGFKQGPPIPDPGTPGDPVGKGGGPNATDIQGILDKLPEGNKPWIREVRTPQDLENLWKWMRQNGMEVPNGYGDPTKGSVVTLPDGTRVGQRVAAGSNGQPVLDIKLPEGNGDLKVHINPRGGIPEIPPAVRAPVVEAPPRGPVPVEAPPVRGGGFGGGVIPDGTMPRPVHLPEAGDPDLPVIGDGIPDRPDG